jgi:DeoR family transcriptional regulator, deoxyribose operon repressor
LGLITLDRRTDRVTILTNALSGGGALHLRDAAQLLKVSEMTVRRDIAAMPDRFSYLGGYIVPRLADGPYRMDREASAHAAAKAAVGARAAAMITDDDTIFIDCGTTTPHLVQRIPPDVRLTVVCYALNIANPLAGNPNIRLIVLGGLYNASSASFDIGDGLQALSRLGINKAFMSAGGIDPVRGVSCSNFHEVPVKQAVIRMAVQTCLLVDGSKIGKVKPAPFAALDDFHSVITTDTPEGSTDSLRAFQGNLVVV